MEAQGSRLRLPKCHRKSTQRSTREHLGGKPLIRISLAARSHIHTSKLAAWIPAGSVAGVETTQRSGVLPPRPKRKLGAVGGPRGHRILSCGISPRGTPGDPSPEREKRVRLPNSGHQFTADDRDLKDDGRGSNPILGQVIASRANNARGNRRSDWWGNLCFAHRHAIQNRGPNMYYLPEIL